MRKYILKVIVFCFLVIGCEYSTIQKIQENYSEEVSKYAKEYHLSEAYLKALIAIECSGNNPADNRFEENIYKKLKEVRDGKRKKYEFITKSQLRECSDDALKNLANSWGPFQIMGYKCIQLGIKISDLRGPNAVKWGVKWINHEYGNLIRNKEYEHAFRFHNTGKINGKTFDPNYVENGLNKMNEFEQEEISNKNSDIPNKLLETNYYNKYDLKNKLVLFVDFSKNRNEKRLWVIENNKIIAHSYVSHGKASGKLKPIHFSNKCGSNMSSLGIYKFNLLFNYRKRPKNTGYKIILDGLDDTNNNARIRNVVIHAPPKSKKYVTETNCTGNSDGCFVVSDEIFELLKSKIRLLENSFLVATV